MQNKIKLIPQQYTELIKNNWPERDIFSFFFHSFFLSFFFFSNFASIVLCYIVTNGLKWQRPWAAIRGIMSGEPGGVSGGGEQFSDKDNPLRWRVGRVGRIFPRPPRCMPRRPATSRSARWYKAQRATGAPRLTLPPLYSASLLTLFTTPRLHRCLQLPGPYYTLHARTESTRLVAAVAAASSEQREAAGRQAPSVDGEPLWSMAAPSSGGGRRSDVESVAAVVVVASATTTVTPSPAVSSKMTSLQRPSAAVAPTARLTDTQVAAADKSHRRKISLPWFRQASASTAAAALARQHTIDTPSSYRHKPTASRSSVAAAQVRLAHGPHVGIG